MPEYMTVNLTWKDVVGIMEALSKTQMEHLRQSEENQDPIECLRANEYADIKMKFRNAVRAAELAQ